MQQVAHELVLYSGNTSLIEAMKVTPSAARAFFESKTFEAWKKAKEEEAKRISGINERLNTVIGGLGSVAKSIGAIGNRR